MFVKIETKNIMAKFGLKPTTEEQPNEMSSPSFLSS